LEITVNRRVLVPRPETELLAEASWQFLSTLNAQPSTALDFGTGSGCIAIALAVKCPHARVVASDASAEALAVANVNAARHGVGERLEFRCGNGFVPFPAEARFQLIVSNPPYVPTAEIAALQPEVRDFDPHTALDGGPDGLDFYRLLAAQAGAFLRPGGRIMLEFGDGQADSVRRILEVQKWIVEAVKEDYSQRPRHLIARR
jgi:release factor glutamine methyltransferase